MQEKKNDKVTKANRHGVGVWGNPRKVISIRVDSGLYKAFKPIAKAFFGSVCRPIEAFMASIITCNNKEVSFGNTIKIEKLHIERNFKPRRKLKYESCEGKSCKEVPEFHVERSNGQILNLCQKCLNEYQKNSYWQKNITKFERIKSEEAILDSEI